MKKLNELQSLVKLAQNFGQEPDPKLLAEIAHLQQQQDKKLKQQTELKARVRSAYASLELFEAPAKEYKRPSTYADGKSIPANLPDLYQPASNAGVPENQRCDNCKYYVAESKKCTRWNNAVVKPAYWCAKWDAIVAKKQNEEVKIVRSETSVDLVSNYIKESTVVGPEPVLAQPTPVLEQKVKQLEAWISRIAATGSGSGEVNFRWLDDVDRSSIDQNKYLTYNPTSKKFQFEDTRVSIEAFDRSTSIALTSTPQLLRPNIFINSKNLTYDTSTGIFTFLTQCEVSLALTVNAVSAGSNHRVYQYAERNTGSGFQPIANSGKNFQLVNGQNTQIVNAQTISRLAGEQIRYFIYSDSADKVTLITETLPNVTGNTVFVPAIRIQYAGR